MRDQREYFCRGCDHYLDPEKSNCNILFGNDWESVLSNSFCPFAKIRGKPVDMEMGQVTFKGQIIDKKGSRDSFVKRFQKVEDKGKK